MFTVETIVINSVAVKVAVPPVMELKKQYDRSSLPATFPYWAKIWPAAKALSMFMIKHQSLIADKKITEIAAGLGLPSLVAASMAQEVVCTDVRSEAIEFINTSIHLNGLNNIKADVFDWNQEFLFETDVILMSDVNYNPESFKQLFLLVQRILQRGAIILLATPQRLMAKPFIESISNFISQQEEYEIKGNDESVICSVFLLKIK